MISPDVKETILIVDDSLTNRMLLNKIFSGEYIVEQAENGVMALEKLRALPDVAAVILDLQMPVMDGYGVLNAMHADERLKDIPVVVDTIVDDVESQLKALDCGAMDVMIKPFNPQIALHRVRNILTRREADRQAARNNTLEQLLRQSEIDEKTGMFNKHAFCRRTAELLATHPEHQYVMLRWDVDRFKVYNDVFGMAAGDAFLAKVGAAYRARADACMTYGHWEADHFVTCIPKDYFDRFDVAEQITRLSSNSADGFDFVTRMGVYIVDDPTLDVALMCDRALLALRSIKDDYTTRVAYYDESMRAALIEEQEIVGEMDKALEQGQFVVYLQPQYDYAERSLHGAEALVRWNHPEKGLIPPGKFIPIFERNGFISKVDEYVWEQVCRQQRAWLDAGKPAVPISVNISRRDIYNPGLCGVIEGLTQRYGLPHSLLRLEITESAYMENAEQLIKTVETLRAAGFAVEMDDFGSGYSSLNTLKEVPVDMLKLDIKFLEERQGDTKGGSILTSVIRMAQWINLPVIAEGVETREQAEYLKSVGCSHMQGYYFARPMPIPEHEALLSVAELDRGAQPSSGHHIEGAANFLSASTQATLLFNSFVGGAAVIEYDGANVEALRLNDKYFEVLGVTRAQYEGKQLRLLERFDAPNRKVFLDAIHSAIETGEESSCEVRSLPLNERDGEIWVRTRLRLLAASEGRYILYVAVENISKQRKLAQQLAAVMDSVPGGILDFEVTDRLRTVYFNDITAAMFGYRREEYEARFNENPLLAIHPDDMPGIQAQLDTVLHKREQTLQASYRHSCADGTWRWVRLTGHIVRREGDRIFASGILMDIDSEIRNRQTAKRQAEELERQRISLQSLYDTIPCGIMQFSTELDAHAEAKLLGFNDTAWRMMGYDSREQYVRTVHGRSKLLGVHPEDVPDVRSDIAALIRAEAGQRLDRDYRIVRPDGGIRWLHTIFQKMRYTDSADVVQVVFTDITERKRADMQRLGSAFFGLFEEVFEFDVERDICFMRSAKEPDDPRIGRFVPFSKHLDTLCQKYALPEDGPRIRAFYSRIGRCGSDKPETLEYRYFDADGNQRWASATLLHLVGSTYLTCNRDVTDQHNAQRLAEENAALHTLVSARGADSQAADVGAGSGQTSYQLDLARYTRTLFGLFDEIFEMDFEANTFLLLSSKFIDADNRMTRQDLHEAMQHWQARFVDEEDRAALRAFVRLDVIQETFRSGRNPSTEYAFTMPDGTRRYIRSTLMQLDDRRYLCCNRDVTEQKKAEQLHREVLLLRSQSEAQERYRIVVEQTGMAVIDMNYETGEYTCSEAYNKYETSRHNQEIMLQNAGDRSLVHPDDQAILDRFFAAKDTGAPHAEAVLRAKMVDGSYRWTRMAGTYLWGEDGQLKRVIGTFIDIDAQMRAKRELEQLSERMRRIIANIPTGVVIFEMGEQTLPVYVSDKAGEMFGFSRAECDLQIANGESLSFTPDAGMISEDQLARMRAGQMLVIPKLRVTRKDGSWFYLRAFCSMGDGRDGSQLCYAVLADITDEVALEQKQVWQAEKYAILSESADLITFDYTPGDDVMRLSVPRPGGGVTEEVRQRYLETIRSYARIRNAEKDRFAETLGAASRTAMRGTYDFEGDYYGTGMRWYRAKYVSLADEDGAVYRVVGRLDDVDDILRKQK